MLAGDLNNWLAALKLGYQSYLEFLSDSAAWSSSCTSLHEVKLLNSLSTLRGSIHFDATSQIDLSG